MHKALFGLLSAVFCSFVSAQASSQWKIIHAGSLLADAREEVRAEQSIIIRNNVIVDVRDGYVAPGEVSGTANAKVIDLSNQFVLPGLIDSHTHILSQQEPNSREIRVTRSDELSTLMGYEFGMRTLRAGFTTIRNVGGTRNAILLCVMPSIRALSWGHASKRPVRESHRPVVMVTEADFATTYFRILTPECAMA